MNRITAADGTALAAQFFQPAGAPRAAVLVVPAMGVPQSYYRAFAAWLAREGFLVATFDYRGMGASRHGPLRRVRADIIDWAELDTAAALKALTARAPHLPLYWVGHSVGGHILPFVPGYERVAKMITVACGSGYWAENTRPGRWLAALMWFLAVPLLTPLFGYFPGRRLRMVADLPRGAMEQWRRWSLNPEYSAGAEPGARERYAAVRTPIVSLSFTDDEYMSARNTESLHGFYVNAPRRMRRFAPQDLGQPRIGHFGFFRQSLAPVWRELVLPELSAGEPVRAVAA